MNGFPQTLLWCPVQVTVLVLAALGFEIMIGRRRPAAGALVGVSALIAVVGLTAAAFSPWPSWPISWDVLPARQTTVESDTAAVDSPAEALITVPTVRVADNAPSERSSSQQSSIPLEQPDPLLKRCGALIAAHWAMLLGLSYLIGLAAMALRIVLGLAAVRRYRLDSRSLEERRLVELVDVVRSQLGCVRNVELREADALDSPATIGWRRPILLLPHDWRGWSEDECRAVLAHEIEHVRRNDFPSWIAAQIGIALHFYHPLVHWLGARLRLKQELAADAAAARVVGGQRQYLATLAAMALRRSDAALAWPAHAFIPSSKTFLRRIEILHRWKSLPPDVSRPVVISSMAAVALAAVCAAGLRGSSAGEDPTNNSQPFSPSGNSTSRLDRSRKNLKQLALAMHNYHARHKHFPPAVALGPDGKTPHSWRVELLPELDQQTLYGQYRMDEAWDSPANKKVLEQMPDVLRSPFDDAKSTNSGYYVFAGPGAIFDGEKGVPMSDIMDGTSSTLLLVEAKRNVPWTKPDDIPFDPTRPPTTVRGFTRGQFLAALADGSVHSFEENTVKDQLVWLILRHDGRPIGWQKIGEAEQPQAVGRGAANEEGPATPQGFRDKSHLKRLALAMHNYHDLHGHFPAAVVMGPDGKTPHSWRVELLPQLSLQNLYDQYRMNEPWDSPSNKKVLEQMAQCFRSPYDDPKSTDSGYFVLVGPDTVFDPSKLVRISDISDGTCNTFLIVEAKRNVPWTKPEDIPFSPDQAVPALGGFVPGQFAAAMCDGSVHLLTNERIKDELKWLIMRNDAHLIDLEALGMQQFGSNRRSLAVIMQRGASRASTELTIEVRNAGLEVTLNGEHLSSVANAAAAPYTVQVPVERGENRLTIKMTASNPFREYVSKELVSIVSNRHSQLVVEIVGNEVVAILDNHRLHLVAAIGPPSSFNK